MELVSILVEVCGRLTSVLSNISHSGITVSPRVLAELRIFDKDSFQFYFRRMGSISDREGATGTSTREVSCGSSDKWILVDHERWSLSIGDRLVSLTTLILFFLQVTKRPSFIYGLYY